MMQLFIFLTLEEIGRGGLFDFGATLPLLVVQFALLTFVLNIILYQPILDTLSERDEYVLTSLTQAADLLDEAELITEKYELDLQNKKKQIQADVSTSEKMYKQVWDLELEMVQKECAAYVEKYYTYLQTEKENAFEILEKKVDLLGVQILGKLFGNKG